MQCVADANIRNSGNGKDPDKKSQRLGKVRERRERCAVHATSPARGKCSRPMAQSPQQARTERDAAMPPEQS